MRNERNKGRIGQNEQNLVQLDKICQQFKKFYDDYSYEDLFEIYQNSFMDYISYLEVSSNPDKSEIVEDLQEIRLFSQFINHYLVINQMCAKLQMINRSKKVCTNFYSELKSELNTLRSFVNLKSLVLLSEVTEAWARQDETITLVEYEDNQATFMEANAWFNRLKEWLEVECQTGKEVYNA